MLIPRMIRVMKLDSQVFEEVEHDPNALNQAIAVVVIATICSGIGAFFGPGGGVMGLIFGIVRGLIGWAIWSVVTYFVGTTLFKGKATIGEMLRVTGFAYTPSCLGILAVVPLVGWIIAFVGFIWWIVAGVIAVRQGLDVSTGKAVATVLIATVVMMIVMVPLALLLGLGGAVAGG